ncbi:hypothetical protein [Xanthomonas sp. 3075]|uniref:hypothetical protein n=1 Tax=Xanthomonas sp. 3075 TaxID=3035315 RepID=UPI0016187E36|nr:hypothetical protein [Xanthomonas sp. 3075]MBB4131483.1 hypothetical protein [Xanthomonas sp. 3075]
MPSLICDLEDLLASWKTEAETFDACDMPASALAFRDCHRRLTALLHRRALHAAPPTPERDVGPSSSPAVTASHLRVETTL